MIYSIPIYLLPKCPIPSYRLALGITWVALTHLPQHTLSGPDQQPLSTTAAQQFCCIQHTWECEGRYFQVPIVAATLLPSPLSGGRQAYLHTVTS
ncbi:hypothetical protein F5Y17DRAFT_44821 [Xylariaceae sp. FL0594]|nr:hypothetical protein F5Y17DRAFT_44821 [Xylariaceae sp. FL0594]